MNPTNTPLEAAKTKIQNVKKAGGDLLNTFIGCSLIVLFIFAVWQSAQTPPAPTPEVDAKAQYEQARAEAEARKEQSEKEAKIAELEAQAAAINIEAEKLKANK